MDYLPVIVILIVLIFGSIVSCKVAMITIDPYKPQSVEFRNKLTNFGILVLTAIVIVACYLYGYC